MSQRRRSSQYAGWITLLCAMAVVGCAEVPRPYVPKPVTQPAIQRCNDFTGHVAGTKPWVFGGTCCCTPSESLMALYQRDGFCTDMDEEALVDAYAKAGVKLRGPGHMSCNGLCDHGPHVVLGGKCMCPPTPGTAYYEQIVFWVRPPQVTPTTAPSTCPASQPASGSK